MTLVPANHQAAAGDVDDVGGALHFPEGIFAAHPDHIRVEPLIAARLLRALTMSLTHPMIAAEASAAFEIVDTVLHGVGTGTPT